MNSFFPYHLVWTIHLFNEKRSRLGYSENASDANKRRKKNIGTRSFDIHIQLSKSQSIVTFVHVLFNCVHVMWMQDNEVKINFTSVILYERANNAIKHWRYVSSVEFILSSCHCCTVHVDCIHFNLSVDFYNNKIAFFRSFLYRLRPSAIWPVSSIASATNMSHRAKGFFYLLCCPIQIEMTCP